MALRWAVGMTNKPMQLTPIAADLYDCCLAWVSRLSDVVC
jgi:hypothetical protein